MSQPKTLVFGKTGQVAQGLQLAFPGAVFLGRDVANFERPKDLLKVLDEINPKLVINAAAYTEVDKAEIDVGRAQVVNAAAPTEIAGWCRSHEASLIHYSTDYVYTGDGVDPWRESDPTGPKNYYGKTKLEGENGIVASRCHHIILRTSWVFSPVGKNFVKTMIKLGQERESLKVVDDQVGSPTYAPDIAAVTWKIAHDPEFLKKSGIFNAANSGAVSWHGFSEQIFKRLRAAEIPLNVFRLEAIPSSSYPTPAIRPRNSRLDTRKLREIFSIEMRPWQDALDACLEALSQRWI
jgi:dTDP-4-dehydrorhamnose reductase